MNVLRFSDRDFSTRLRDLTVSSLFDRTIEERARVIVEAVHSRGDAALLEFTAQFDGAHLTAEQLAVTRAELLHASLKADAGLRQAVSLAARNIEMFSRKSSRPITMSCAPSSACACAGAPCWFF